MMDVRKVLIALVALLLMALFAWASSPEAQRMLKENSDYHRKAGISNIN